MGSTLLYYRLCLVLHSQFMICSCNPDQHFLHCLQYPRIAISKQSRQVSLLFDWYFQIGWHAVTDGRMMYQIDRMHCDRNRDSSTMTYYLSSVQMQQVMTSLSISAVAHMNAILDLRMFIACLGIVCWSLTICANWDGTMFCEVQILLMENQLWAIVVGHSANAQKDETTFERAEYTQPMAALQQSECPKSALMVRSCKPN